MLSETQIQEAYKEALAIAEAHRKRYQQTGLPSLQTLYWWTRARLLYWILGGSNEVSSEYIAACEGIALHASRSERIARLNTVVKQCTLCDLCKTRNNTVLGFGSPWSPILVVLGPPTVFKGVEEVFDVQSSFLFEWMREVCGYGTENIYTTNIVKCSPKPGRVPNTKDITTCSAYLETQISVLDPKVILVIGSTPARKLTRSSESKPMLDLRGKIHWLEHYPVVVANDATQYKRLAPSETEERGKIKQEFMNDFALLKKVLLSPGERISKLYTHQITEDEL